MLDIKRIRKNPEELVAAMKARRNKGADVSGILELDEKRREVIMRYIVKFVISFYMLFY